MIRLVFGVGFNDGKYPAKVNGKTIKEYNLWCGLLERCYCPKLQKKRPTYIGCLVSENFKSYSYFYDWVQKQIGFGEKGFQLDKDLIFKGNKLYSEETCLFLPSELNSLLTTRKAARGILPVGVSANGNGFQAGCCTDKTSLSRYLGRFNTPELAFQAYKQAKEDFIKLQAEKWKALIDPRAYAALMAYTISITD